MINFLNLRIFSPSQLIVEEQVKKISFEDNFGALTILPRHQDYVSSFKSHLLTYVNTKKERKFLIISDGVVVKSGKEVNFSVYSAIVGETLEELKEKIGGFNKRGLDIKTDKENRIEENLKTLENYFFEEKI